MQSDAQAGSTDAGVRKLFGNDLVEAEVIDSPTAELLGDLHAEKAIGTRRCVDLARCDARALPVHVLRSNLFGHP